MDQVILENLDTSALIEKMREIINNVKDAIMKIWNKVKDIFYNFIKALPNYDKEYKRILNIEKRVKSKRLKKKYRRKILNHISKNYLTENTKEGRGKKWKKISN